MFSHRPWVTTIFSVSAAFMLTTTVFAVQEEIKDKLPGRWLASAEKTKAYQAKHEDAPKLPDEFFDQMGKIEMTFDVDGQVKMSMDQPGGESRELEGKWESKEEYDADPAILRVAMMVNGIEDARNVSVEFEDDSTLVFQIEDQPAFVLIRQPEDSAEPKSDKSESDKSDDGGR